MTTGRGRGGPLGLFQGPPSVLPPPTLLGGAGSHDGGEAESLWGPWGCAEEEEEEEEEEEKGRAWDVGGMLSMPALV